MASKLALLKAALSELAGQGRKFVPLSEETVMKRIQDSAEDIARSIKDYGGVSFSPRQNRIFEVGKDYGEMMSVVKEAPNARTPATDSIEELARRVVSTAQDNPELLARLMRGENLGGWISKGELVLDPSKRFVNRDKAIIRGMEANQDAGFNLSTGEETDLKYVLGLNEEGKKIYGAINEELRKEALRRLRLQKLAAAGLIGTPASLVTGAVLNED